MEKHEWIFKLPRITEEVEDRLDEGIDWIEGNRERAESIFRKLIIEYPEHIDAYHHLGLTLELMGRTQEAFHTRERAVATALNFFPAHFSMDRDRLDWGFIENRPFLRLYHSFGLQLMKRGGREEALAVFENLLTLNPNDNQGARASAVECLFVLKRPDEVLSLCRQYPGEMMEQLLYGRALALFQLDKLREARKALDVAIKCYPLIAKELLKTKHRKPRGADERYVTLGSLAQAYLYWKQHGEYWVESDGALHFVRNRLLGISAKRR